MQFISRRASAVFTLRLTCHNSDTSLGPHLLPLAHASKGLALVADTSSAPDATSAALSTSRALTVGCHSSSSYRSFERKEADVQGDVESVADDDLLLRRMRMRRRGLAIQQPPWTTRWSRRLGPGARGCLLDGSEPASRHVAKEGVDSARRKHDVHEAQGTEDDFVGRVGELSRTSVVFLSWEQRFAASHS